MGYFQHAAQAPCLAAGVSRVAVICWDICCGILGASGLDLNVDPFDSDAEREEVGSRAKHPYGIKSGFYRICSLAGVLD